MRRELSTAELLERASRALASIRSRGEYGRGLLLPGMAAEAEARRLALGRRLFEERWGVTKA